MFIPSKHKTVKVRLPEYTEGTLLGQFLNQSRTYRRWMNKNEMGRGTFTLA